MVMVRRRAVHRGHGGANDATALAGYATMMMTMMMLWLGFRISVGLATAGLERCRPRHHWYTEIRQRS